MIKVAFLTFASEAFKPRAQACIDSIKQYHSHSLYTEVTTHLYNLNDSKENVGSYVPGLAKYRLEKVREHLADNNVVILVGADCIFYNDICKFIEDSFKHSIMLTPHLITPPKTGGEKYYRTGHVNADLIGFNHCSLPIIDWLIEQPLVDNILDGIFYEQTWLSAVPFLFDNVGICKDPKINYAYFNIHERSLTRSHEGKWIINNNGQLRMAQFSGYIQGKPERLSKHYSGPDATGDVLTLFQEYDRLIT